MFVTLRGVRPVSGQRRKHGDAGDGGQNSSRYIEGSISRYIVYRNFDISIHRKFDISLYRKFIFRYIERIYRKFDILIIESSIQISIYRKGHTESSIFRFIDRIYRKFDMSIFTYFRYDIRHYVAVARHILSQGQLFLSKVCLVGYALFGCCTQQVPYPGATYQRVYFTYITTPQYHTRRNIT